MFLCLTYIGKRVHKAIVQLVVKDSMNIVTLFNITNMYIDIYISMKFSQNLHL